MKHNILIKLEIILIYKKEVNVYKQTGLRFF